MRTAKSLILSLSLIAATLVGVPIGAAASNADLLVPTQYPTIQAAIDVATPGDTVRIRAGTYVEQLDIDKDLTLRGSGAGRTIIKTPAVLQIGSLNRTAIVDIHDGASVKVSHLAITGPKPTPCGDGEPLGAGIRVSGDAALDLSFAKITKISETPVQSCNRRGSAIGIGSSFESGRVTVRYTVLSDFQAGGIVAFGPATFLTVEDSIIAAADSDETFPYGIELGFGSSAIVKRNIVTGNQCDAVSVPCGPDPFSQGQAAGFGTGPGDPPGPETEVAHNLFANNDVGIYLFGPSCCDVHDNLVINNRWSGIAIQEGEQRVRNDVIIGGRVGVSVIAGFVTDSIGILQNEQIYGTSVAPTAEVECCGFNATVIVSP